MKRLNRIAVMTLLAVAAAGQAFVVVADDERIEVVSTVCTATPVSGGIALTADSEVTFEVYSITGQRVKTVSVDSGSAKVELPKGCYIVRCPRWSKKVVVK